MKLRNKKTGEIKDVESLGHEKSLRDKYGPQITLSWNTEYENLGECRTYNSLAELNAEWEDYKEPKNPCFINWFGEVSELLGHISDREIEKLKEAGNYFETKEEAEKAVEKLKAWKRLKELGFRFIDWELDMKTVADGKIWFDIGINTEWDAERLLKLKPEAKESLDTFFGGEE